MVREGFSTESRRPIKGFVQVYQTKCVWRVEEWGTAFRAEVMMACTKVWMQKVFGVPKSSNRVSGAVQTGSELKRYMITLVQGFQSHVQEFRYMLNSRGNNEGFNGV